MVTQTPDDFVRSVKESKIMNFLTLKKNAIRLFESLETTRTSIESNISEDLYTF